jgi:Skp family chaperone for outer membrane proteins
MCRAGVALGAVLALVGPAAAQVTTATDPAPSLIPQSPQVLTLDQDRLYRESRFGRAAIARIDAEENALIVENSKIFAVLEAEEKALTARRPTLEASEFSALATEFDTKAQGIRTAQDAKGAEIARKRQEDQRQFFDTALPILAQVMTELGAVAILDKQAIILSYDKIDMTDRAIARIDAQLGDGSTLKPAP